MKGYDFQWKGTSIFKILIINSLDKISAIPHLFKYILGNKNQVMFTYKVMYLSLWTLH